MIIASQGAAGAVTLIARVAATLPVVAEFPLVVVPLAEDLQLKVTVQGVGSVTYSGEDADPWQRLERTLLNADVDSGRLVSVLTDPRWRGKLWSWRCLSSRARRRRRDRPLLRHRQRRRRCACCARRRRG